MALGVRLDSLLFSSLLFRLIKIVNNIAWCGYFCNLANVLLGYCILMQIFIVFLLFVLLDGTVDGFLFA